MPKETFQAKFDSLAPICEFVSTAAKQAGLSDSDAYAVELATNEAATNIIEHAYDGVEDGRIEVDVAADENGITVTLRDWGKLFDIDSVPEANFGVPLEDLNFRGAGLRMIRSVMDDVEFEPIPGEGNRVKLRKNR